MPVPVLGTEAIVTYLSHYLPYFDRPGNEGQFVTSAPDRFIADNHASFQQQRFDIAHATTNCEIEALSAWQQAHVIPLNHYDYVNTRLPRMKFNRYRAYRFRRICLLSISCLSDLVEGADLRPP